MQMDQNDRFLAQRGETLRLSGAYEEAIKIFEQLQQKYPDNAWVHAHQGTTYYQLMDYGKAEDYLKKAIEQNDEYLWAHAQLGETYRLLAIVNNRKQEYVELAINHFKRSLDSDPENGNYAWALAHLGATYRLKITLNIESLSINQIDQQSKEDALKCLNRAIELIPTYAWAWGMRATVYRLAQEYEDSLWDLGVETVIAPNTEVLQGSSSPVPSLESRRVNLHEHAFLSFYLTKKETDKDGKRKHYERAIAFALQALIVNPGDLIAHLILIVIEANQKKEKQGGCLSDENDISNLQEKLEKFFEDAKSEVFDLSKMVLRHLVGARRFRIEDLEAIRNKAGEEHKLIQLVLKDVIENPNLSIGKEPQLWLWKNFALTETFSSVLFMMSDVSFILKENPIIGKAQPYRELAAIINPFYTAERFYQTPAFSEEERSIMFKQLFNSVSILVK